MPGGWAARVAADAWDRFYLFFVPRMLLLLQDTCSNPWPARSEIVHFLTDNDSIGEAVCKRAEALSAAAVVMAKHQRGAIAEFFLGSGAAWLAGQVAALIHCAQALVPRDCTVLLGPWCAGCTQGVPSAGA